MRTRSWGDRAEEGVTRFLRSGITPVDRAQKGVTSFMVYMHAISAGHLEWVSYAFSLLAGAFSERLLMIVRMRGFGGRGFGRRGLGPFRLIRLARILFVLLFTTVLGPIVLVALLVFAGYWFYANRQR